MNDLKEKKEEELQEDDLKTQKEEGELRETENNVDEASSEAVESEQGVSGEEDLSKYVNPEYSWYIVNTYSGSEESVKISLLERIEKENLAHYFGEVYIPKTTVEKVLKSGKKKTIDKTSFPGYIIIQMKLDDRSMACVNAIPKVTGFVGNRRTPKPMRDQELLQLVAGNYESEKEVKTQLSYEKGDQIKVIDGPFTSFNGVVDDVKPEKMKVKVLVSIFGRETPVELTYEQVEKID